MGQLRRFLSLAQWVRTNWIEICPTCDGLYYVETSYEFLIGGSEDLDSYERILSEAVVKLPEISWIEAAECELQQFAGGRWAIAQQQSFR